MRTQFEAVLSASLMFALLGAGGPAQDARGSGSRSTFVVIVNAGNPITSIDREKLSRIFLKRSVKWPDGGLADPIDLDMKEPSRAAFSQVVHRKSVGAVRAFWQQQIFSGRDVPPAEKANESDVTAYVRVHAGAVGYVSADVGLPPGVKVLSIEGVTP